MADFSGFWIDNILSLSGDARLGRLFVHLFHVRSSRFWLNHNLLGAKDLDIAAFGDRFPHLIRIVVMKNFLSNINEATKHTSPSDSTATLERIPSHGGPVRTYGHRHRFVARYLSHISKVLRRLTLVYLHSALGAATWRRVWLRIESSACDLCHTLLLYDNTSAALCVDYTKVLLGDMSTLCVCWKLNFFGFSNQLGACTP